MISVAKTKHELRLWAKRLRQELDIAGLSRQALPYLIRVLEGKRRILIYHPLPGELDPTPLRRTLAAAFFLPRIKGNEIVALPYREPLERGPFGVLEPSARQTPVSPQDLEAVIVPALAYDRTGHRLGHGKGFYDRFLMRLPEGVLTVGLVPSRLLLPELPRDPWDVPVKVLVTEEGIVETEAL